MPMAERRAECVWQGNLLHGDGQLTVGSGAFGPAPVSWPARTERPDGKTSPEELIAAAQAVCYAMALSHTLTQAGHAPDRLTVDATCALDQVGGGLKVTTVTINVTGSVTGLDASGFQQIAQQAKEGCPVSNALKGNVDIQVNARLD